jgi:hypothetical protein
MTKRWTLEKIKQRLNVLMSSDKVDTPEFNNLLQRLRTERNMTQKSILKETKLRERLNTKQSIDKNYQPFMSREEEIDKINKFVKSGKLEILKGNC